MIKTNKFIKFYERYKPFSVLLLLIVPIAIYIFAYDVYKLYNRFFKK